jgi:hypothetical protein
LVVAEGDEIEAAEDLGGVAFVAVEVALFLNEDVAVFARKQAEGEVVSQEAGGQERGVLLSESGRHGGLKLLDGAVDEVDIGDVGSLFEQMGELVCSVLRGDRDGIANQGDGAVGDGGRWRALGVRLGDEYG